MIDYDTLLALRLLLEQRHISRAAKHAGITQPAMSRTLMRLQKIKDALSPEKANAVFQRICSLFDLERGSDLAGKAITATDLANFHSWGKVQSIIDSATESL